jgi:acyl-CoA reductase-like NAD-dependent aldehyde dehydrogenase
MSTQTIPTQIDQIREIVSYDPGTGAELGRVPLSSPEEVVQAARRAGAAQPAWASLSFKERSRVILKAREIMLGQIDELATLISRETGKPVSEAISMEVVPTLDAMHYFATHTASLLKPQKIDIGQYSLMGRSSQIVYKP